MLSGSNLLSALHIIHVRQPQPNHRPAKITLVAILLFAMIFPPQLLLTTTLDDFLKRLGLGMSLAPSLSLIHI